MPLYFIGLGLCPEHLTLEAIRLLREADRVYLDTYTSIMPGFDKRVIEQYAGGEVVPAPRSLLEQGMNTIIEEARRQKIAIAVPGDPFIATTHDAIRVEALRRGVEVRVAHSTTIYSVAPSATGLQAYRFGKTVTLVYPEGFKPYSVIETIHDNLDRKLHTLLLLDLRLAENRAMTIPEAVDILLRLEEEYCREEGCQPRLGDTLGVGLAHAGCSSQALHADLVRNLSRYTYPGPPHSIIVVAEPHPVELDSLYTVCGLPSELYRRFKR